MDFRNDINETDLSTYFQFELREDLQPSSLAGGDWSFWHVDAMPVFGNTTAPFSVFWRSKPRRGRLKLESFVLWM